MRRSILAAAAALCAALIAAPAAGGPLIVAPTRVEMRPDNRSAVLYVTNDSDASVDLQFRAFAWSQGDGRDTLTPTDDLVVSPAIVTVAPHARQTFRVLRLATSQPGPEPSYRLKLNELPRPTNGQAIAINLEFSLPVFVSTADAKPSLAWSRQGDAVTVRNTGDRHMRITTLSVVGPDETPVDLDGAKASYILAGSARTFALPLPARLQPSRRIVGTSDFGDIDVASSMLAAH